MLAQMRGSRGFFVTLSVAGCALAVVAVLGVAGAAGEKRTRAASHTRIVHLTPRRDAGIFTMKPNGRARHRLRKGLIDGVSLSANGRRMAFANSRSTPCSRCAADFFVEVFVADGNARHANMVKRFRHANLFSLSMSFDGRWVVLSIYKGGDADLYLMRSNGSHVRRLTNDDLDQAGVSFSPNGRRIVFSQEDRGGSHIYSMRAKGGERRRLTNGGGAPGDPVYSPNGRWIAYSSTRGGNSGIFVMRSDGSRARRLTNAGAAANDFMPDFSPNGRSIAFAHGSGLDFDIVTIRADGGNMRRIRHSGYGMLEPDWTR
jgi:dipeptidyl aminopeptidase/acylaminoacyl peptidase